MDLPFSKNNSNNQQSTPNAPGGHGSTQINQTAPQQSNTDQQTSQNTTKKSVGSAPSPANAVADSSDALKKALSRADLKPKFKNPLDVVGKQNYSLLDVVSPQAMEVDFDFIKINNVYFRTLFVSGYPRFVSPGWLEQIVNFDGSLDISFFIYPIEGKGVLTELRHKVAEMEAEIATDLERGKIVNPATQAALDDAQVLQNTLVTGSEHFFEFAFYVTIPARTVEELNHITKQVQSTLGSLLVKAQHATLDMENAFLSSLPFGIDRLNITRNMDTTSLATTFPLTSAELSADEGILYGINPLNDSFIIFDRFSLENSNMTVFATSGAGKTLESTEPVLFRDEGGSVCLEKIGDIVENQIEKKGSEKFDEESEGVINSGIKVFTFDENLKSGWSNVEVAARKKPPKDLYKIFTRSGREITTTKDHNFIILQDGKLKIAKGESINKGLFLPLPRKVDYGVGSQKILNIERLFAQNGVGYTKLANKRLKHPHPATKNTVPSRIELASDFYKLLGLFAAEGMITPKRALISNSSKSLLDFVCSYYKGLNVPHSLAKRDSKTIGVHVGTQLFCRFLIVIGASGKADVKRVPPLVFSASNENAASFLSAYFEGDGGVDGHEISATTKSKQLASDLSYLLLRFGIIARVSKTRKSATNTKNKTKRTYYKLRISGQDNIKRFIKEIGFLSKEKTKKSKNLVKEGNTNIDTIPGLEPVFEDIYNVLYKSSEIPAPKKFSEIKLGTFKPSRYQLLDICKKIERRIEQLEILESDGLSTLNSLPNLQEIISAGKNKKPNSQLWNKLGGSWWTMQGKNPPKLSNTLKAISVTHGYSYAKSDITDALYRSFKTTGESLLAFDKSLWDAIINKDGNPLYSKVIKAKNHINKKYLIKTKNLENIKRKVNWLKTLATSDLFWDQVVKVEKVKSKYKYVYDLQVDNGVFLAGYGGMFIHNSYFVKLESVRSLMLQTEIIVIDPESEYKDLAEAVGGQYISFSFKSPSKINPFDLSQVYEEGENQLGLKILSLHALFKIIMGALTPSQEALLDRALVLTYKGKGITQDPETQTKEPPLMEDLYKALVGMETDDALDLAARIEKFVKGSFIGIFDQQTNVDINNPFTVFSVRELQDALRPIAMFVILDFIWTRVKRDLKKRILVVDEAWHMMRYEDSAQFLWSIVKRARKYYLGITTITQDVEDFLAQDIGKAVVTNSALRVLLKQSPAAIETVGDVFFLSEGEKNLLLGANIGEGIFFAGRHHVPISVVASPEEDKLITTKPQDILDRGQAKNPLQAVKPPDILQQDMPDTSAQIKLNTRSLMRPGGNS